MKIEEYLIKESACIPWPTTFEELVMAAIKSSCKWFILYTSENIIGCVRREAIAEKIENFGLAAMKAISIEDVVIEASVSYSGDQNQLMYEENKIVVIKDKNNEIQGVLDWELDDNLRNVMTGDEWLMKEFQTVFDEYYRSVLVTDEKGKVIRVTSEDDQQYLGKNVFDLEKRKIFYPSITAKVFKSGKRENGLQYTNTGEIFDIESIPVKNEQGKIVRVVSITKNSSEVNQLKNRLEESRLLLDNYQREVARIQQEKYEDKPFIYTSKKMEDLFELIKSVAAVDASVLVLGETGVGKQMVANQIHLLSDRNDKPFITINCGAIPENLLESELFGYEEGAFSGTRKGGKLGIFEIANNGTLFLDEIGEMSLALQVKLLRVLQEKVIMKVGGTKEKKIDVRIITATNKDLSQMVKAGTFREDLYYRINVVPIHIPSLRERREDIQALAFHFLQKFNLKYKKNVNFGSLQLEQLLSYSWPGNVRELENVVERFVVMEKSIFFREKEAAPISLASIEKGEEEVANLFEFLESVEKQLLLKTMRKCNTTREMAKSLGVNQSTIVRKLQKYKLIKES
ncbi:sigma-54 interaction domain-containing protein [Pseudobacillus wudalianchiensis]|nr:sigma 54-interacting transcriptional regulator [Bacillus wudalianchiensis]